MSAIKALAYLPLEKCGVFLHAPILQTSPSETQMKRELQVVLSDLRMLKARDFDYNDLNAQGWEQLYELCEELRELNDVENSAADMFGVMERLDSVDLGSPGPLVQTLEGWGGSYEKCLAESVARKPSRLAVWMVNRILNTKPDNALAWLQMLRAVALHPLASPETKAVAKGFLAYQQAV